jgi:hypothetical protein
MKIKAPLVLLAIEPVDCLRLREMAPTGEQFVVRLTANDPMFEQANKPDRPSILSLDVTLALEITQAADQKNR